MARYDVKVSREGKWWVVDVAGVGVTQAAHEVEIEPQARGLIAAMVDDDDPELTWTRSLT